MLRSSGNSGHSLYTVFIYSRLVVYITVITCVYTANTAIFEKRLHCLKRQIGRRDFAVHKIAYTYTGEHL